MAKEKSSKMPEQSRQKDIFEINLLEMQMKQLEQQFIMVEQQIIEQQSIALHLEELKKLKKGQNMLFPIGNNIFIEGNLQNSEEVIVNVGAKIALKKSIDEAKRLVEKQRDTLIEASEEIKQKIQEIMIRLNKLEFKMNENSCGPECGHKHHAA